MKLRSVFDYVDANSPRYIEDLSELIRHPSVAAQNLGMKECGEFLARKMNEAGIVTRLIPTEGYPVVYGEVKRQENRRTILFYAHYDVQPPDPLDEWKTEPFSADMRDGKIYGRGASDDKCGVMATIKAVESHLLATKELPTNVKFLFEGEEEIGSPHLEDFVRDNRDLLAADGLVGFDGTEEIFLGTRGMLYVELSLEENRLDFHSREAGVLMSPVWRLVWALSTLKNNAERITIDGFYERVKHPTREDIALIRAFPFKRREFYRGRILPGLQTKEKLIRRRLLSPTCNIDGISAGYAGRGIKTVLPRSALAKVDFRLVPNQDPENIFTILRSHLSKHGFNDIRVRKLGQFWPSKTYLSDPMAQVILKASEIAYGRKPLVAPIEPGSGPEVRAFTKYLNLNYIGTGAATTMSCNHAPNEFVGSKDYVAGIKKAAAIIQYFGQENA